jgi:protein SCO1/2
MKRAFVHFALFALALAAVVLTAAPAAALLTQAELARVGLHPGPGARIPENLLFTDDDGRSVRLGDVSLGRPTLLMLADAQCRLLCGPMIATAGLAAQNSGLAPGADYNFIVVGIGATAPPAARRMKTAQLGETSELALRSHFLSADAQTFGQFAAAIGFSTVEDVERRLIAHPTELLILTSDGRLSRVLSGLGLDGAQLRFALIKARDGALDALIDRAHVFCYGFDPAQGRYNRRVRAGLIGGGIVTICAVGLAAALAQRRRLRSLGGGL